MTNDLLNEDLCGLLREARDNAIASTAEVDISADRRAYRRELAERLNAAVAALAKPAAAKPVAWQERTYWDEGEDAPKWGAWYQCQKPTDEQLQRAKNLGIKREYRALTVAAVGEDAARLDWLVGQDNCVVNEGTSGFWLCWIDENDANRTEYQKGSFPTARDAIDAAMRLAAHEAGSQP
jgi:hypothetical protein